MFIYKLSSWVDRYDPFWYGRLIALKAAYLAIGLFIANLILQPPLPTLVMLFSAVGVLIAELPAINDLNKKDNVYLAYVILICLTVAIFSSSVYLKGWFILAVSAWAYVLYFALRKKPELYALVSAVLMLGMISLEGYNSGNFFSILNTLFFILEFSLIAFWLHKFFPFLYSRIWMSSILRSLETLQNMLTELSIADSQKLFRQLQVSESSLNLLVKQSYRQEARLITDLLSHYHYYLNDLLENKLTPARELDLIGADLLRLEQAVRKQSEFYYSPNRSSALDLTTHNQIYPQLQTSWNKLCALVNS